MFQKCGVQCAVGLREPALPWLHLIAPAAALRITIAHCTALCCIPLPVQYMLTRMSCHDAAPTNNKAALRKASSAAKAS